MAQNKEGGGKITGYWGLPKGRPTKANKYAPKGWTLEEENQSKASKKPAATVVISTGPVKKQTKGRKKYVQWTGENKKAMDAAVTVFLAGGTEVDAIAAACKVVPTIHIARSNLYRFAEIAKETRLKVGGEGLTKDGVVQHFDQKSPPDDATEGKRRRATSLTTSEFRAKLQHIICARDDLNNGATQKEGISIIADAHGVNRKKAEDHLIYLIRQKMLPELKKGGKVVSAQGTTTQRTAITTEKLLRNHTTYEMATEQVRTFNGNSKEFLEVEDHFHLNSDESNMRGNEGTLKVMGSKAKKSRRRITATAERASLFCELDQQGD